MDEAVLVDDLVEEILLRFPPDDPAYLVRAALVCKGWCRLVSGTSFRRRFREFHGTRPMLGFLCNLMDGTANTINESSIVRFVPTSSSRSWRRPSPSGWQVLDSRHGRVLLCSLLCYDANPHRMVVWDPITDEQVELPMLPPDPRTYHDWGWNAAVLCATSGSGGSCDVLDCHPSSPFLVVLVGTMTPRSRAFARVYSSEVGTWSNVITSNITREYVMKQPCALAGDALYLMCLGSRFILKFDLTTRRISGIRLPGTIDPHDGVLTANQDGGLEFAEAVGSRLHLWSREADLDDEDAGWTRRRVIELKTLLPTKALSTPTHVLGFAADGVDVIFVQTCNGMFTIYPKSDRVMKIESFGMENESKRVIVRKILPYVNLYTPDFNRHI